MKLRKRKKRHPCLSAAVYLLIGVLCVIGFGQTLMAKEGEKVVVEYYYYSSCDGCTEGEYFENELKEKLKDVIGEEEYEFVLKNVSIPEIYEEFMEVTKNQKIENFIPTPPLLKIRDIYLFGIDEITERSRDVIIEEVQGGKRTQEDIVNSLKGIDKNDAFFVYFYVPGCKDCQKAQKYFESMNKTYYTKEKEVSNLKITYINIGDFNNIPLAQWFFETYQVDQKNQKAPAIFYQNGYLQGFEDIKNEMPRVIENGDARNWEDINYVPTREKKNFTLGDWGILIVTGIANGLNPCGLSILFFFLSLLLTKKERIWKLGIAFIAAKMLTYLLLGTVFSSIIGQLSTLVIKPIEKIIRIILAVFIIIFAILNFVDIYFSKNEKYGKIKMQLPKKLKKFNNNYLEKVMKKGSKSLVGVVFLAAIIVSVGEFLCTGQLYLASIIYVMEKQSVFNWSVFFTFILYILCMCLPLIIITLAVDRSAKLFGISEFVRKKMPMIKLIYGILFLIFAAALLIY